MHSLQQLQADLDYNFSEPRLLKQAVTHSSHAHESGTGQDNEQLEFLGDAILGFLVSDFLVRSHPTLDEGQLSKLKGFFVSSANLVKFAQRLCLGDCLQLGRGEEKTGGRTKQALLVDAFEAILGAMYIDGGIEPVRRLLSRFLEPQIRDAGDATVQFSDFKTALQERLQSRKEGGAHYVITNETGPAHEKVFTVEVIVGGHSFASGLGLTRKAAEQAAAREAMERLNREAGEVESMAAAPGAAES